MHIVIGLGHVCLLRVTSIAILNEGVIGRKADARKMTSTSWNRIPQTAKCKHNAANIKGAATHCMQDTKQKGVVKRQDTCSGKHEMLLISMINCAIGKLQLCSGHSLVQ